MIDGTFKTSPELFYQLYAVHGVYHGVSVPFIYGYLPSKKQKVYSEFFKIIRNKTEGLPEVIISDFERAAINACRRVFPAPATKFSGCLFHLTQSIFHKVQQNPQ